MKGNLVLGIDTSRKEQYLSDGEFFQVFKITKDQFASAKDWKKASLKKNVGLF